MVIIYYADVKYSKHKPFYVHVIRDKIYHKAGRSYVRNVNFLLRP